MYSSLKINGIDTTTMNHIEVVSLLRSGSDEVKMNLLRYPHSMQTQEKLLMLKVENMLLAIYISLFETKTDSVCRLKNETLLQQILKLKPNCIRT